MRLIDTHCHLTHGRLAADLPGVLERAREAGVVAMVCAAASSRESRAARELCRRHACLRFTAGIHPHDAKDAAEADYAAVEQLTAEANNAAVGEIGLDYHYNFSPPEAQREAFARQLEIARRLGKRIVIHTREAFEDTMAILRESGVEGGLVVFHSFTEGPQQARQALDFGSAISFSGIVTFNSAEATRQAALLVPDDRILIETDSPFLSPEPVRRMKTNEPANVVHVCNLLAALRHKQPEALAELTTENAKRFFECKLLIDGEPTVRG